MRPLISRSRSTSAPPCVRQKNGRALSPNPVLPQLLDRRAVDLRLRELGDERLVLRAVALDERPDLVDQAVGDLLRSLLLLVRRAHAAQDEVAHRRDVLLGRRRILEHPGRSVAPVDWDNAAPAFRLFVGKIKTCEAAALMARAWLAFPAFVLTPALAAQEPPPTFKAEAEVVVLDVVARDDKGRPVPDLRSDEIQVFEDGKPCTITSFRLVRGLAVEPGKPPDAPPDAPGADPAPGAASAPSRANLVVLLFDRLLVQNAAAARRGALDLLNQRFPADTWFAVYKMDRSMRRLQTFTSDPRELTSAVEAATSGDEANRAVGADAPSIPAPSVPEAPSGPASQPDLPGNPPSALSQTGRVQIAAFVEAEVALLARRVEAFDSLHGISALARGLGQVRGRKTILFFAEDREIPLSAASVYDLTMSAANRANVTVHTIDTRGLVYARPGDRSAAGPAMRAEDPTAAPPEIFLRHADGEFEKYKGSLRAGEELANPKQGSFLEHVAGDTGGLAINRTNDIGAGLARVVEEIGQYYEVVYEPPRPEPDGRFRRIEAKTTRKGVHLRTRSGYFATAASAPSVAAFELPLLAAMGAAEPPHDFRHAASVMHFGSAGSDREALFLAEVPLGSAKVVEDPVRGTYRAHLSLLCFVRDENGRPVARLSQDWPIEGPIAERGRLAGTTASFRRALQLPPGGYTLVTAVQDREANRTSVERTRFDVPPAEGTLTVGSLAVIRKASGTAATDTDPLRVSGVSIAPVLGAGELPAGTEEVPLFLPIYPSLAPQPIELKLEVKHAGQTVAAVSPQLPPPSPDGRIAWIGSLPTARLSAGDYELVATVRQGDAVAEERARFALGDRSHAAAATRSAAGPTAPPVPEELVPVLDAAARYVLEYEASFRDLAADETYTQWAAARDTVNKGLALSCPGQLCRVSTRADLVFVRLPGPVPWGSYRDVYEVDGRKVRDRDGRLEALFAKLPSATAEERARALLSEGARYNIGPAIRTVNFPTLALTFLHPASQGRFAWSRGGRRRIGAVEAVEVEFEEVARPTIVDRGREGDLPARGRFWIDPARGTVLRSEVTFRFELDRVLCARRSSRSTTPRSRSSRCGFLPKCTSPTRTSPVHRRRSSEAPAALPPATPGSADSASPRTSKPACPGRRPPLSRRRRRHREPASPLRH
jgi:VWFA-related protein